MTDQVQTLPTLSGFTTSPVVVTDYPYGQLRTSCTWSIESSVKNGTRVSRQTINPKTGKACAPKRTTYSQATYLAQGDDGRTYIVTASGANSVSVSEGSGKFCRVGYYTPRHPEFEALATAIGMVRYTQEELQSLGLRYGTDPVVWIPASSPVHAVIAAAKLKSR